MGRARKKLRKAPDFERKKNKVGKGKQTPKNVTQINFKTKRVVVPCQWESNPDGPTSHRKQTLQVGKLSVCNALSEVGSSIAGKPIFSALALTLALKPV